MQTNNLITVSHITEEAARKKVSEMSLINGFLFDSVLEDQADAITVTQAILTTTFNKSIKVINVSSQKTYNAVDTDLHGIRFDAQITPADDGSLTATIYDVEMEDRDSDRAELPRRLRYYTALSDDKQVKSGKSYKTLPDFVTVTISSYDPFSAGDMYYAARSVITTHPYIEYEDGILHVFLYCKGKINEDLDVEHGKKLTEMLKYILSGEKPTTLNTDIEAIDDIVTQVKKKPEVTINYMKQWDREDHIRTDTKLDDGLGFILFSRNHNISDEDIRSHLETNMHLMPYEIDNLFRKADAEKDAVLTK